MLRQFRERASSVEKNFVIAFLILRTFLKNFFFKRWGMSQSREKLKLEAVIKTDIMVTVVALMTLSVMKNLMFLNFNVSL